MSARLSLSLIFAITLWRVTLLAFDRTDLFVDEAQYWLWSQHLDFGYYSKPPMIAWVIHLFTAIGGSQEIFWIRLAGPLFHGTTALILMQAARRLTGEGSAPWVGVTYATLPGVSLSSLFLSTDTILFLFLATGLWAYSGLIRHRSMTLALIMGVSIGLGMLSKYAMTYFVLTAALSAAVLPQTRIAWRDAAISAITALIVLSPNIVWNAMNGNATLKHTTENAGWTGLHFHLGKALEFFGAQFGVAGPVIFAAMIWAAVRMIRGVSGPAERNLVILSWPIILAIVVQALMSRAYANWAAAAYAPGVILAVALLYTQSLRALQVSLAIALLPALFIPLLSVFPDSLTLPGKDPVLSRYLGRSALSREIASLASREKIDTIVADDRDILADLFHTLRDAPLTIYARTETGFPHNYYEQEFPLPAGLARSVLYVSRKTVVCADSASALIGTITPAAGSMKGRTFNAYRVDANCLIQPPA